MNFIVFSLIWYYFYFSVWTLNRETVFALLPQYWLYLMVSACTFCALRYSFRLARLFIFHNFRHRLCIRPSTRPPRTRVIDFILFEMFTVDEFTQLWINGTKTIMTDGDASMPNSRVTQAKSQLAKTLSIEAVSRWDSGNYTCKITSEPAVEITHSLRVLRQYFRIILHGYGENSLWRILWDQEISCS